jgi:BirA family biotin operon repressor/biotin-[acetyl-CoA-carboxylase] ligase
VDLSDLTTAALAEHLGERPIRSYPALLSTDAEALAWARAGGPEGAIVISGYQASPRGRGGIPWVVDPDSSLTFSLILRPKWPSFREGWLYTLVTTALADVIGDRATIEWPDEVRLNGQRTAGLGGYVELVDRQTSWAVATVHISEVHPPRGPRLAQVLEAIEARYRATTDEVLADYLPRCETIGRRVRACMVPLGPAGPVIEGKAVSALLDGALVLETAEGRRIAVRPQNLGMLEDAQAVTEEPVPESKPRA